MIKNLSKLLISIRRQIHQHPELGDNEYKTSALIEKTLQAHGIKTSRPGKTGVIALIEGKAKSKGPKRCVALRGDIDALPITEQTGAPFSSQTKGVMHACGHDANCTMVLGAALLLSERKNNFSGTVKCLFQPNEESSGGAKGLIRQGALARPAVDAIVGIHVSPWLKMGELGLKRGAMMAAVDHFTIEIIGEGGHGAYPHLATDAVVVAANVINALQTIVSRQADPVEPLVLTIGQINGGERYNIIAGKVTMVGTVRTLSEKLHRQMPAFMERKIKNICAAYGAKYTFKYQMLGNVLENSDAVLEVCRQAGNEVLGAGKVTLLEKPSMGGEDFAQYLRTVPGCFLYIGAGGKKAYPWHHEKFNIDERVLPVGAKLMAATAEKLL
jgi:amidohydrolase